MENIIQKINKVGHYLNISSESFMLFALVCVFAIPFVIAKSIEPAVYTDSSSNIAYIYVPVNNTNKSNLASNPTPVNETIEENAAQTNTQYNRTIDEPDTLASNTELPDVLGLIEENDPFMNNSDSQGFTVSLIDDYEYMFEKYEYSVTSNNEHRLRIASGKQMDEVQILKVKNNSDGAQLFSVDVRSFMGDIQFMRVNIEDVSLNVSDVVWPQYFTIQSNQEMIISFSYGSVKMFDVDIQVQKY